MMKFLAFVPFFLGAVSAQDLTPATVLDHIRKSYSGMNDVSALFLQHVQMKYKRGGQTVSGSVKIKKGNKYRLETDQQTIVTDGAVVWMYTPKTKQVIRDTYRKDRVQFSPDRFLLGLPKEFTPVSAEKDSHRIILTLKPSPSSSFSSVMTVLKVWVDPGTWIFTTVELTDRNSTVTTYSLSDIRFNKGIADSIFSFDVTGDMKVVDMQSLK